MRRLPLLLALAFLAACGPQAAAERVSVMGLDRLSGDVAGQEVELPGADLVNVRGPAGIIVDGAAIDGTRVSGGGSPECALRRKVSGALVARTLRCVTLLGQYAALERGRQFLLSIGAEALFPAIVAASDGAAPGLRYVPAADAFALGDGPRGARVPGALNPGAVARELARRHLRTLLDLHAPEAEGIALFLGAAAAGDPGYLGLSDERGDPVGELDLSRPLGAESPASAVLAGSLWTWADASGDLIGAARAALAAARALDKGASGGPAAVLSLVAAQLEGAERDQACAVFRARLSGATLPACP